MVSSCIEEAGGPCLNFAYCAFRTVTLDEQLDWFGKHEQIRTILEVEAAGQAKLTQLIDFRADVAVPLVLRAYSKGAAWGTAPYV